MSLTINITLDDEALEDFVRLYNADAGTAITVDTILQSEDFKDAVAEDMISEWFESLHDEDLASPFDLYSEFF